MKLLNDLLILGQTQTGSLLTLVLLALTLLVRRGLPSVQRSRSTTPLFFLCLAFLLGISATVSFKLDAYTVWGILSFLDLLSLIIGIITLSGLVIFDLILTRTRFRVPSLIRDLLHISLILLIVLTILYQRGLDPLSLLTTSAVLTAVIGLALQNTIANLFAGLALQLDRTLGIHDWVKVRDKVGRIAEIKWRSTLLWTEDGDLLIVPNGQLLDAEVLNLSRPDSVQREEITVGFHYRHPPNEVKRVLLDAAHDASGVLATPAPDCLVVDFAESAVTYKLRYWIKDYTRHSTIESEVRTHVWYAAQRAGLEIPFPIRTVVMLPPSIFPKEEDAHLAVLAQTNPFSSLPTQERSRLAAHMKTAAFGAGESILREGATDSALYLVRAGEIAVAVSTNGSRRDLMTLKSGDFFCGLLSVNDASRSVTYKAKSDAVCSLVDQAALEPIFLAHPQFAEDFSSLLASREMALESERQERSVELQVRQSVEMKQHLLARMRQVFQVT
jgi:small-conductance mechanosensitive channel